MASAPSQYTSSNLLFYFYILRVIIYRDTDIYMPGTTCIGLWISGGIIFLPVAF